MLRRGRALELTSLEARLLSYLQEQGEIISRERLLEQVWGYRPGVQSRTVDTTMRRLREKVELDPDAPRHLITVHGRGYRFVAAPSLSPAGPVFGREAEMEALRGALARARLVSVLGRAGQGRSTLVREVARRWGPAAELRLDGARGVPDLDAALARALGLQSLEGRRIRELSRVGEQLVLLRTEGGSERALARRWVSERLEGELRVVVVGEEPLDLPGEESLRLAGLDEGASVALLRARVGAGPSDAELREVARSWDGWPLALLHAAERLHLGARGADPEPALQEVLSRSWEETDPEAREALAWLTVGVVPPALPEGALPWLARDRGRPELPPAVARWVRQRPEGERIALLAARRRIAEIEADPGGRWESAAERVLADALPPELRVEAALALAERALSATTVAQARGYLDRARALGMSSAQAARRAILEARIRDSLGDWSGAKGLLRTVMEDAELPEELRAEGRIRLAWTCAVCRDPEGARALLREPAPTPYTALLQLGAESVIAQLSGLPEALPLMRRALQEARRLGRREIFARWAPQLAILLHIANRDREAEQVLREAIVAQAEVNDVRGEIASRIGLAQRRYDRGALAEALSELEAAEVLLAHRDQPRDLQVVLGMRAMIAMEEGRLRLARSLLEDSQVLGEFTFAPGVIVGLLGTLSALQGELETARLQLQEALVRLERGATPERHRRVAVARLLAVQLELGVRVDPAAWPPGGSEDAVEAAVDVERLHLALRAGALEELRAGWRALPPPRSGSARISRQLLRAAIERAGLNPDETL